MTVVVIRPGETPEEALRRLEREPDYARLIGTPAGQELLERLRTEERRRRREAVRG